MHLFGVSFGILLSPRPSSASIVAATRSRHRLFVIPPGGGMDTIHEEIPSRPTSGMTINVGFFPTVPSRVEYGSPSWAISGAQYSQIEYENVRVADVEHERKVAVW